MSSTKNAWSVLAVGLMAAFSFCSVGFAQVGGGDGGGDGGIVEPTTGQVDPSGGSGAGGADGEIDPTQNIVDIEISDNTRNQGFVGATTANIENPEQGFVGAVSEQSGPGLSDDASFGGGVNDVSPITPSGASGESNSFTVVRKSIRAKLRPNFYSPQTSGEVVSSRFQNHFSRQPGSQLSGSSYTVIVSDRTAYIRGSVNTSSDSERLERQLRLEPGVYRIVNELSIAR